MIYEYIRIFIQMTISVWIILGIAFCLVVSIKEIPEMLSSEDKLKTPWEKEERKKAKQEAKKQARARKLNHWWEA